MKRLLFVACLLALAAPSPARTSGFNLAWGEQCWTDDPVNSRTFACDSNSGVDYATGSFVIDQDMPDFFGLQIIVDICSGPNDLPDWWQMWNPGSCRATSLSVSPVLSSAASAHCVSPWQGSGPRNFVAYQTRRYPPPVGYVLPNGARIKIQFDTWPTVTPLSAGVEYLAFRLAIDHQNTLGGDACAGCGVPVEMAHGWMRVNGESGIVDLIARERGYLAWNGGLSYPCYSVPVRNATWGQVKGMYR